MPMIKRFFLLLCLFPVFLWAQESSLVKRRLAVVAEDEHPQLRILAQNLEAELLNLDSLLSAADPDNCDAVVYLGRLQFGSRSSLWVRGFDRYAGEEVFTDAYIFQDFDLEALLTEFLPRIVLAIEAGFPSLDAETARIAAEEGKEDLIFNTRKAAGGSFPVSLRLEVPPETTLILEKGIRETEEKGFIEVRALPGSILPYRLEAPGYVAMEGEFVVGGEDETRLMEMVPYADWAVELKARLWEFGASAGIIRYLLDEEIYLYAVLEQNILSLKNFFTLWDDARRGFLQPVIGIGGYGLGPDSAIRPYMGFGVLTRVVFGDEGMYLSKTLTAGIDISMGLDVALFGADDKRLILEYTPRFFYSSFYDQAFEDYHGGEGQPIFLEGNWHLRLAGPVNLGIRWKL